MSSFQPIFKITPGVQSYDWGKIGSTSLAAQFGERCIEGFTTDDKKPYAEVSIQHSPSLKYGCPDRSEGPELICLRLAYPALSSGWAPT
jgi:hypothetical protein